LHASESCGTVFTVQVLTTSKAVRAARESAGLTQQTLAHNAGIALRTLARIEAGEDCTLRTLARIAMALDVPLAKLVDLPGEVVA
jgi:transcriptional regulator with XRE-family HTH domain